MSVLDPRELQASPLADLHALATELGLEGFRRLRKDDLIKQIVEAQGGSVESNGSEEEAADPEVALFEGAATESDEPETDFRAPGVEEDDEEDLHEGSTADFPRDYQESMPNWQGDDEQKPSSEASGEGADSGEEREEREEDMRAGILDVLPNGSGFIRAEP